MSVCALVLFCGVCGLESVPEGVRARSCEEDVPPGAWTIPAPPAATAAAGVSGGFFHGLAVDVMVDDGNALWMGVSDDRHGDVEPRGLVRHDRRGATQAFRGTDAGPCGFQVRDLLLRGDTLWVATDLGVSRLRLADDEWDEWTHYAPSADGTALEETACGAMLSAVADAARAPGGAALERLLAEFRPKFARRLRRGTRPASR